MADDPLVREVGRLEDGRGRVLIVGVSYDAVTLRVADPGDAGDDGCTAPGASYGNHSVSSQEPPAVELGMAQQEELGQLLIAAVWQAAWQRMKIDADTDRLAAQGGAP